MLFVSFVSFCARGAKIHSEAFSESGIATSDIAGGTSGSSLGGAESEGPGSSVFSGNRADEPHKCETKSLGSRRIKTY